SASRDAFFRKSDGPRLSPRNRRTSPVEAPSSYPLMASVSWTCGSLSSCFESTPDPRPPENSTTRTVSREDGMDGELIRNRPCGGWNAVRGAATLLAGSAHQELHVWHHLLHRRDVHLARAQTGRALGVANPVAMLLAGDPEVQLLGILGQHVSHDLAVLTEEQSAVGIEHDA